MVQRYEKVRGARFTAEVVGNVHQYRIRPRRAVFLMGFLIVWGVGWTTIGGSVNASVLFNGIRPTQVFPLLMWLFGVVGVLSALSWLLTGVEILSVSNEDLTVTYRMLGFGRSKRYRATDISDLVSHGAPPLPRNQISIPILFASRTGSVRFTYGARTVYLAEGLDVSEGRLLAASLREDLRMGSARRPADLEF